MASFLFLRRLSKRTNDVIKKIMDSSIYMKILASFSISGFGEKVFLDIRSIVIDNYGKFSRRNKCGRMF
ncbi:MAG: hypothetical protein A2Z59_00835 [Nitrospinae bacterium RIFCSPLOWO2_02_39_17]|nr:MAG: hypothetical protein A2Z59_00835 [Nitrospinae bacterium RIFCSPLOWO2_02_39_17]